MTQLTWQNVAVPQFDVGAGYNRANELISGALNNVGAGAEHLDQARTDQMLGNIRAAVSGAGSVDAAQQMLRSGQIGGVNLADPEIAKRIDPAAIQAMIDGRIKGQDSVTGYDQKTTMDSHAADIAAAIRQSQSPDIKLQAQGADALARLAPGIGAANVTRLLGDAQATNGTAFAHDMTNFGNTNEKAQYETTTQVKDIAARIRAQTVGGTAADQQVIWQGMLQGGQYSGRLQDAVNAELGLSGGGGGGSAGAAGGAPGGGAGGVAGLPGGSSGSGADRLVGDVKVNLPAPPSQMTLAQWTQVAPDIIHATQTQLSPDAQRKLGLSSTRGSSAMGTFQILPSTAQLYAKKLGWSQDTVMDAPHQEAVAQAIWNDVQAGKLDARQQFASLPAGVDYKGKSFDQIKGLLAQGESGANPTSLLAAATGTAVAQNTQNMAEDPTGFLKSAAEATAKGNRLSADVAKEFAADRGITVGQAQGVITQIQDRATKAGMPISADMAATIAKASATKMSDFDSFLFNTYHAIPGVSKATNTGVNANLAKADQLIGQLKNGGLNQYAVSNTLRSLSSNMSQGNTAAALQAKQEVLRINALQAANPGVDYSPLLDHYQRIYNQSSGMAGAATAASQDNLHASSNYAANATQAVDAALKQTRGSGLTSKESAKLDQLLKAGTDPSTAALRLLSDAGPAPAAGGKKTPAAPPPVNRAPAVLASAVQPPNVGDGSHPVTDAVANFVQGFQAHNANQVAQARAIRDQQVTQLQAQRAAALKTGNMTRAQQIAHQIKLASF
jgi:hypothetical protein